MSGILGIWNFNGRPVEQALLDTLSATLAHRGLDGEARWMDGDIGFAFQNLWITPESVGTLQPVVRTAESVVMLDGRLDNREELLSILKNDRAVSKESSDAVLVAALYGKTGEGFAEHLKGDFAAVVYDVRERRLLLARDPLGVRPLYFSRAADAFIVASEIKPILAHPSIVARPNAEMLAAALLACLGQDREGWTFFDKVSSVLPGQIIVVTPERVTKQIYWDFGDPDPIRLKAFPEYVEAFREHFERAVARRLRSAFPVTVSVSGGVDSSSVYCTAASLHRRYPALCPSVIGMSMEMQAALADESLYLDAIEEQYGTRIERVPSAVRYAAGSVRKFFRDMEAPYFRGPADSSYPFQQRVRDRGGRVLLSGLWSDQLLADTGYLVDFARQFRWVTVRRHLAERTAWISSVSFSENTQRLVRDLIRYEVPNPLWRFVRQRRRQLVSSRDCYTDDFRGMAWRAEAAQQFNPPGKTAHQRSLYRVVRPMYYVQALELGNKIAAATGCEYAHPFFDRDLISFLLAIPGSVICPGGVPKGILRTAMRGTLPSVIADRRWKAEITKELGDAMDREFAGFARYLNDDPMAVRLGYVDESRLKVRLPALKSGISGSASGDITQQLGDLFGLELWLQSFFGTKLDAPY